MDNNPIKKIRIAGSVGSGKTTIARKLSEQLQIPYYELDNVVYIRKKTGDIRRNDEERNQHLTNIVETDSWIIEGVHNEDWTFNTFKDADLIIFLDPHYSVRTYRIIRRFILQLLGTEKANYKPTVEIFFKMFKWNRHFEKYGKPNVLKITEPFKSKLLMIANLKELENKLSIK